MLDAVLRADPVKKHLHGRMTEPAGEHLAVIRQNLLREPWRRIASARPSHTPRGSFSGLLKLTTAALAPS
jgi:hypothetical protein